jgi:hypothetical protein
MFVDSVYWGKRAMKKLLAFGFVLILTVPTWAQPLPPAMKPLPPFGKPLPSLAQPLPSSLERQVRSGNLSRQEASDLYEASKKVTPTAAKPTATKPAAPQPEKPVEQPPKATTAPSDTTKKPEDKAKDKTYSGTISIEGFPKLQGNVFALEAKKENEDELNKLKTTVRRLNNPKSVQDLMEYATKNAVERETFSDSQFKIKARDPKAILVIAVSGSTGTEALWVINDVAADQAITVEKGKVLYWAVRPTGQ